MAPRNGELAARFLRALEHPRLPLWLGLLAALLASPSLAIGFHLDDYVHRYMLSDRPGGAELLRVYESPFGIANGEAADNLWQIDRGYAPWWTHPDLLVSLWRPVSEATHRLDAALFPDSAPLQHLHSLLWLALCCALVTHAYRALLGPGTVAGLAAVMYALDHAHGFAAGWIANRNALVAAALGALALLAYVRARQAGSALGTLFAAALLMLSLLAGESSVAVLGYALGHALFVERAPLRRRVLAVLPQLLVVVAWRIAYVAEGRGARHSGLYLDPLGEPLAFARAALERVPALVMGQLALPPAEAVMFVSGPLRVAVLTLALGCSALAVAVLLPALRADRDARMLGFGTLCALVLACSTHPNNRLLFYVGLGAMPLLSIAWHGLMQRAGQGAAAPRLAHAAVAALVGFRLVVSPLLLPVTACSVLVTAQATAGARSVLAAAAGHDVLLVSSPDYFHQKLVPVLGALEGRAAPQHLLSLSFGDVPLVLRRTDERTLEVAFEGGILGSPLLELYRARGEPMPTGTRVALARAEVEVTSTTADGRPTAARFRFRTPLPDPTLRVLAWDGAHYVPYALPEIGERAEVAGAPLRLGF